MNFYIREVPRTLKMVCMEPNAKTNATERVDGEVSRHGPFLMKLEVKFWSASKPLLTKYLKHVTSFMSDENFYNSDGSALCGLVVVHKPENGNEVGCRICFWFKDHASFYDDDLLTNTEVALRRLPAYFNSASLDFVDKSKSVKSPTHKDWRFNIRATALPLVWLSYRLNDTEIYDNTEIYQAEFDRSGIHYVEMGSRSDRLSSLQYREYKRGIDFWTGKPMRSASVSKTD